MGLFSDALDSGIAKVLESSLSDFAAMVSNCDLFVTCDSGPMHLACALGTRTVAIFQNPNFDHWAPPSLIEIVHINLAVVLSRRYSAFVLKHCPLILLPLDFKGSKVFPNRRRPCYPLLGYHRSAPLAAARTACISAVSP